MLAAAPGGLISADFMPWALALFWAAVVLTLWTGAAYGVRAVGILRSGDDT
jgi:phosphatidylglycerophosphate synthase